MCIGRYGRLLWLDSGIGGIIAFMTIKMAYNTLEMRVRKREVLY
ncbi:hypothetical protein SUNDANCE_10 [Brevibacillus phage Sundance]|nr:hypothetical protein AVT09_gp010 [Brevibacillus phage Sundance]ALA47826.1 hypothetical protein SUNDANCE_10 [Brevibacillus phage Sundance]